MLVLPLSSDPPVTVPSFPLHHLTRRVLKIQLFPPVCPSATGFLVVEVDMRAEGREQARDGSL